MKVSGKITVMLHGMKPTGRNSSGSQIKISRFISAYNNSKEDPDRLDAIAGIMGWQNEDWASIDDIELDEEQMRQLKPLEIEEVRHIDPYTIHRHPIYISSSALYSYLRNAWEHLMRHNQNQPEAHLSWGYCASLSDGERHSFLAANCLDLGDYLLAVCHLKKAHAALNESLRINRLFSHQNESVFIEYLKETTMRMHDLREIWLRVMHDCRK
jgi:hypothetical protein